MKHRKGKRRQVEAAYAERDITFYERPEKVLKPATRAQAEALELLNNPEKSIIFLTGFARTGKSYLPTVYALQKLFAGDIQRIILTRPAKEAGGEELGFLPGTMQDKFNPYIRPFVETFKDFAKGGDLKGYISAGIIQPFPLGFMRSMTFHDTFILADEMQSTTFETLELLLTRKGDNTRIIVSGDYRRQCDVRNSGLEKMLTRVKHKPYVGHVDFALDDIVFPEVKDLIETFYYCDQEEEN